MIFSICAGLSVLKRYNIIYDRIDSISDTFNYNRNKIVLFSPTKNAELGKKSHLPQSQLNWMVVRWAARKKRQGRRGKCFSWAKVCGRIENALIKKSAKPKKERNAFIC